MSNSEFDCVLDAGFHAGDLMTMTSIIANDAYSAALYYAETLQKEGRFGRVRTTRDSEPDTFEDQITVRVYSSMTRLLLRTYRISRKCDFSLLDLNYYGQPKVYDKIPWHVTYRLASRDDDGLIPDDIEGLTVGQLGLVVAVRESMTCLNFDGVTVFLPTTIIRDAWVTANAMR